MTNWLILGYVICMCLFYCLTVEQFRCDDCTEKRKDCPTPHVSAWFLSFIWPISGLVLSIKNIVSAAKARAARLEKEAQDLEDNF